MMQRSNQPFFWALFGAGGMLCALTGAMLAFVTGIAIPLGIGAAGRLADYESASALVRTVPARLILFVTISLLLWHAAHRVYHTLHDFGIKPGALAWACCYGVAFAGTLAAVVALFAPVF